jgi:hypothetical protein
MAETSKKKNPQPSGADTAADEATKGAKGRRAKSSEAAQAKGAKDPDAATVDEAPAETKFAAFVHSKKIDPRRILATSRKLEGLRPEDRAIKLNKRKSRTAEGGDASTKETRKPRSGRPVTDRALQAAMKGGQLSGPTKTRILRAVNHLLDQKKQDPIDLRALF